MAHHAHKHPPQKTKKEPIDLAVRFFMIATPTVELTQAYSIYSTQDAGSVSLITWSFFTLSSTVWLVYAWQHKIVPLMVANICYTVIEIAIVIGIIMYS